MMADGVFNPNETKIIYHIDDEETPYLIKLNVPSERVTLGDFKNALNRPNCKFFFKSVDDDFGVVKEEIIDENARLPCVNGRVVSWLVTADGSGHSDSNSQCTGNFNAAPPHSQRVPIGPDGRPISFHANRVASPDNAADQSVCTSETESTISGLPHFPRHGSKLDRRMGVRPQYGAEAMRRRPPLRVGLDGSSELDSTTFCESEDDRASRISSSTDITSVSRMIPRQQQRRKRKIRHRAPVSRTSSITSITESSMSLNVITVVLNVDCGNFLGISIVGHSNTSGDGGIYVGSIMKGGAVALDGRIEPGDMILQVNEVSFENMTNDDAVRVLRDAVQRPGPIKLVVAKNWDPSPQGYFTIPRTEPVCPIDPGAWVQHCNHMLKNNMLLADFSQRPPSATTYASNSESNATLVPEDSKRRKTNRRPAASTGRPMGNANNIGGEKLVHEEDVLHFVEDMNKFDDVRLDVNVHDMATIVRTMARPDSGLDIRDRIWLKITIPNAFIGSDVVDWLHTNVQGFSERKAAFKYAERILRSGYIRHTVNKRTFAEQCYYVFGDLCGNFVGMRLQDGSDCPQADLGDHDCNQLPPLPPLGAAPPTPQPWVFPSSMVSAYNPLPYNFANEALSMGTLNGASGAQFVMNPHLAGGGFGGPPTARTDAISSVSGGSGSSGSASQRQRTAIAAAGLGVTGGQAPKARQGSSGHGSGSDDTASAGGSGGQAGAGLRRPPTGPGGVGPQPPAPPTRALNSVPADLASSKQSFHKAMNNPCEFFVDVM